MYQKLFHNIKRLQTKIILSMVIMACGIGVIIGAFGTLVTRYSTVDAVKKALVETTEMAAVSAERSMDIHKELIRYIAGETELTDKNASWQEKHAFLRQCAQDLAYLDAYIFDTDGADPISGYNVASMDYFTYPMRGETYVSSPYPKSGGQTGMYIVVSTPVYTDGKISSVICLSIDQMVFQEIAESVQVGNSTNGNVYVLDKNGTAVASKDYESVLAMQNNLKPSEEGTEANPALVAIEEKMVAGLSGVEVWKDGGITYLQAYAPISGSDGWSLAVTVDQAEFLRTSQYATYLLIGIIVILLVLSGLFALFVGKSIAAPVSACSQRLQTLAEGDLKTPVPQVDGNDEVAALAAAGATMVASFASIVDEVDRKLSKIAAGDLTDDLNNATYPGDFASLQQNLTVIGRRLNETIGGINMSAHQVYDGSQQVSDGAQTLAQGATEQASSIEELSATVNDVSEHVNRTAENAAVANKTSEEAERKLMECSEEMKNLVSAMADINKKSDEISKIIKVIEDISFQTNILALNAAVEAARAGAAGKGFAVVADEVRSLAGKSAEASQSTAALIESSVSSVQNGMRILHRTEESLSHVVDASRRSAQLVGEISGNAGQQATAIEQITTAIEQIAGVIHMTSATAEESAATSAALSDQAELLKRAVDQFRLKF